MSSNKRTHSDMLYCTNPFCALPSQKRFKDQRGLSLHIYHFTSCREWMESGGGGKHPPPGVKNNQMFKASNLSIRNFVNNDYPAFQENSARVFDKNNHAITKLNGPNDTNNNNSFSTVDDGATPVLFNNDEDENADESITNVLSCTTDQKWSVALLKVLEDLNAPDIAFEKILTWARDAASEQFSFHPNGGLSKRRHIQLLFESITNAHRLLPVVCPVPIIERTKDTEKAYSVEVISYDFVPQLLALLQNRDIMTEDNLLIDVQDPLKPYNSPYNYRGEAISGSVYKEAYKRLITDPAKQLFVPIIQWIDRTHVTGNGRYTLKPYMFSPAIFTEKFRRTFPAWGFHGFLPKDHSSAAENKKKKEGENIRVYHAQLKEVLKTFITANTRLKNVILPIGAKGTLTCDIVTCVLYIIQDIQEGDALCGRYGPHTSNIKRHIRNCDCKYEALDKPRTKCRKLKVQEMHKIASSNNKQLRQKWSRHKVDNAYNYVLFADPKHGIFGATPTEIMHVFRSGMIKVAVTLVLDYIPDSMKMELDLMAKRFHKKHRQTIRKVYPATDFTNGVTNLTQISNAERLGLVFLFVVLSNYDRGWHILDSTLKKRTTTDLRKVLNLFEGMLCFDAWLHLPNYWTVDEEEETQDVVTKAIQKLMQMCKSRIPSISSTKWNFPKFHELLHIVKDISRFGSPRNYCAERPESLLINAAKQPGQRAQPRHATFEQQSAQRLSASFMIQTMYNKVFPASKTCVPDSSHNDSNPIEQGTGQATHATLSTTIDPQTNQRFYDLYWHTRCNEEEVKTKYIIKPALLDFMSTQFGYEVNFCTEYRRGGHIFRCHPHYKSDGPMFDWMTVLFEGNKIYPCRLVAIIVCDKDAEEPYQLIVQSTTKQTGHKSVLLTEWYMSQDYYVISPESIQAPCFVIEHTEDDSKVQESLAYDLWANEFIELSDRADV